MQVKIVDGNKIRNTIDVDFSGAGSSRMYAYIPEDELWIDKVLSNEQEYFTALHNFEKQLLSEGLTYAEVRKKVVEKFKTHTKKLLEFVLSRTVNEFKICVVDGLAVRKYIDPKFIQGGHDLVYDYIPKNTIWLENNFEQEHEFILEHELHERNLMSKGMDYDEAHDHACAREKALRRKVGVAKYLKG